MVGIIDFNGVESLVLSPNGLQTNSFVPTANTAYKKGDLLAVGVDGVLTHSDIATGGQADWHVVCLQDVTAEQSTKHATDGVGIPTYTHAEINLDAVTINGTALTDAQKLLARAHSVRGTSITLRKPFKI